MIGQTAETVILWGVCDRADNRNSNIVGVYVLGQTAETVILCGISDRADSRNSNIMGYM